MVHERILIYGYGNPGRQDDGIGVELASRLELEQISGVKTEIDYQLNVEDAMTISGYDIVVFIDASLHCTKPFSFYRIKPESETTFTTHAMHPESILYLCGELYHKGVEAYVLTVRGYSWGFAEGLSMMAQKNCEKAYAFLRKKIKELLRH